MYGYIYITTNRKNGKQYIGMKQLSVFDPTYLGSGVKLREDIKKHGKAWFDVDLLTWCESREKLHEAEKHFIKIFKAARSRKFYNIASGGFNGQSPNSEIRRPLNRDRILMRAVMKKTDLSNVTDPTDVALTAKRFGVSEVAVKKQVYLDRRVDIDEFFVFPSKDPSSED